MTTTETSTDDQEFRDRGLVVLAVDVNESKKTVKKYLEQSPRSCRIVLTENPAWANAVAEVSAAGCLSLRRIRANQRVTRLSTTARARQQSQRRRWMR